MSLIMSSLGLYPSNPGRAPLSGFAILPTASPCMTGHADPNCYPNPNTCFDESFKLGVQELMTFTYSHILL